MTWLIVYARPASTLKVLLPEEATISDVVLSTVAYLSPAEPVAPVAPITPVAPVIPKVLFASVFPM
jgi:hypothetical protein